MADVRGFSPEHLRVWLRCYPLARLLIAGRAACMDPQQILIGPPGVKEKLNALVKRAQKIGYWDCKENEKIMQEIAGEWDDIIDEIEKG